MTPKLVKTEHGNYEPAPFEGKNSSGIAPVGDNVVIRTDRAATHIGASKLLVATESQKERQDLAATTGTIYALGEDAFLWNATRTRPFEGRRPQPGDRVIFQQYAGVVHQGLDGVLYRLMSENVIGGLIIQEESND